MVVSVQFPELEKKIGPTEKGSVPERDMEVTCPG